MAKHLPTETLEDLSKFDPEEYYAQCHEIIKSFLEGLTPISQKKNVKASEIKLIMKKIKIYDCIRSIIDPWFISQPGLATNYVLYNISGSRLVTEICGALDGSGHYDKLKSVIDKSADEKVSHE